MRRSSFSIITLTVVCLATAAWAQHGGAGVHGAGEHGGPQDLASTASPHGDKSSANVSGTGSNFEARLAGDPNLMARLKPLLPPATTMQSAASGFKNQGQFIAALHVSHNLGIPFDQLKAEMTGADHDSLGKAIQELRPTLSSKTVHSSVKLADQQAKTDLQHSNESSGK